ncbi:hypothetical protein BV22DRAFT_753441 [Leucogyrophana mollusca]|uniref:Uncharacterized protein n=1 Tax=Leucogyrophana mollusca TaxID=85980 RepID=A0ACB8B5N9_9AGAM|nr:hypothetical protein BV22DRAFT_753441 [Leucogyrophana mollusca]
MRIDMNRVPYLLMKAQRTTLSTPTTSSPFHRQDLFFTLRVFMSAAELPPFPLGPNYGAMWMSTLLCIGLWGVTCMQTFLYFVRYQDDHRSLKTLVISVWVLDTTHQFLIVKGIMVAPLFTALVGLLVQGFFVYRLSRFGERRLAVPLIWLPLALFQLVITIVYISKVIHASTALILDDTLLKAITISYLATALGVDIIISASLTYLLIKERSLGKVESYEKIMQRLVLFSINSGAWTAIFSVLAIFARFSQDEIYVVFDFPLCPLYCNALLANLNVRSYVRSLRQSIDGEMGLKDMTSFVNSERREENQIKKLSAVVFAHRISIPHSGFEISCQL